MATKTIPQLPANTTPATTALVEVSDTAVSGKTTIAQVLTAALATKTANTVLAGPTTGVAAAPAFRALVAADLPDPQAAAKGGVFSKAAVANNFLTAIGTDATVTQAQPAFSNLSGSATLGQIAAIADDTILSNVSGGALAPAANTLTAILDACLGSTDGQIIIRNASAWVVLAPGTTGDVLTMGAVRPEWAAP